MADNDVPPYIQFFDKDNHPLNKEDVLKYYCIMCSRIVKNPYQIACGHRICKTCLPKSVFSCICGEITDPSINDQCFIDKSCKKELLTLTAKCECSWIGAMEDVKEHKGSCITVTRLTKLSIGTQTETDSQLTKALNDASRARKDAEDALNKVAALERTVFDLRQQPTPQNSGRDVVIWREAIDTVKKDVAEFHNKYDELSLRLEILEVKVTNGTYVWKVNEIQRRSREARSGKTVSLYSPPFYSSPHGYRICLRAYLYGDGLGKGTHISVFLVIMQSEFDDTLLWPFSHHVSISLINLDNRDASITQKFQPNPRSSSFEKPKSTFNLASGFPQFAPIDVLNDAKFVKNDTVYFRVKLEQPGSQNWLKSSLDE